ncbi:TonB-dependent receptor [Massilia sp. IC2-477]|uniref:TonB-dependent receptor domain-containing protein n=1 Tax=Massilia sp. IC2-477 TaxID=2887198 RepID=UPI001D0F8713|nr:TonB-dependent receptor [Massilia sp. IC2-477]MCC2957608.1 TonB-dependent receptor [Massilia sp. IC2-477]
MLKLPGSTILLAMLAAPAVAQTLVPAQGRTDENAVRQAEDAFGTSVGRETIGLYNASSVRGFSPIAAGNARIDGLYFDQAWGPSARIRRSTTIRVGISAQGYPFPAPTGIVDYSLRKPGEARKLAVLAGGDSYGAAYLEADGELPLGERALSLGIGAALGTNEYPNGTDSRYRNAALSLRWRPLAALEIVPFWNRMETYDDEKAPSYLPAGPVLPPRITRRRFLGPDWADYRSTGMNVGMLATRQAGAGWTLRAGLFRSQYEDHSAFTHLLTELTPDGRGRRRLIADPPSGTMSTSGELRATKVLAEGPRLHSLHLSLRGRDRERHYDGSQAFDLGPSAMDAPVSLPKPEFRFGPQTRDRTRQTTTGVAYEGRWRDLGEIGFGLQKTDYRKALHKPGLAGATARDQPWLYNATAALPFGSGLVAFGSFTRGLEESGVAPSNAVNRNELLPAIRTTQGDLGLRYALTRDMKLVGTVFDLRKPYFNFDAANRYAQLGDVQNRGLELSLAGPLTPRLNLVAGAVLSRPRATGEGVRLGRVGQQPVGMSRRSVELNLDWRTPWLEGLSLDMSASHSGALMATVDNRVAIPARTLVSLSSRYRFRLLERPASLRVALSNLFDTYGLELRGAGAYDVINGRLVQAYLSVDI